MLVISSRSRRPGGVGSNSGPAAFVVRSSQVPAGSAVLPAQLRRNLHGSHAVADHFAIVTANLETVDLYAALRDHVEGL